MTHGQDPSHQQRKVGEGIPRQPTGEAGTEDPRVAKTLGAQGIQGARGEDLRREHINAEANNELVLGMINLLPQTETIDDWSDRIIVGALRADGGERQAKVAISLTLWKQDTVRYADGGLGLQPAGHPRWELGRRVRGAVADVLVAGRKEGAEDISVFVIRVAADAYDAARAKGREALEPGFTEEQYSKIYDHDRHMLQVTGGLPGVVRIRWSQDRQELQPSQEDEEHCRLPAVYVADVQVFSDWHMGIFGVHKRLRSMASALGLGRSYRDLMARHAGKWRPSASSFDT